MSLNKNFSVLLIGDLTDSLSELFDALRQRGLFTLSRAGLDVKGVDPKPDVMVFLPGKNSAAYVARAEELSERFDVPAIMLLRTADELRAVSSDSVEFLTLATDTQKAVDDMILRIRVAYSRFISLKMSGHKNEPAHTDTHKPEPPVNQRTEDVLYRISHDAAHRERLIAIGASAGGTEAIYNVLTALPADLPGIVVVQHMPPLFTDMYAKRLDKACALTVIEASDQQQVQPGTVYVAPGGIQMRVRHNGGRYFIELHGDEKVSGHCPSVDVMFEAVAKVAGGTSLGVILTGMGSDGAKGLLAMRQAGSFTIGQDEATSLVYGMPRVAFQMGGVALQSPLGKIPELIKDYARGQLKRIKAETDKE